MERAQMAATDFRSAQAVEALLAEVFNEEPRRLKHVLEVAKRVRETASLLRENGKLEIDIDLAYRSALLHDIGYAGCIADSGFHPVDGANFLAELGFCDIAEYIICHSNSPEQAQAKGLEKIPVSEHIIADLITYWDVQVKQGGECVSYAERMADIRERYGEDSPVWKAHKLAAPRIEEILHKIRSLVEA